MSCFFQKTYCIILILLIVLQTKTNFPSFWTSTWGPWIRGSNNGLQVVRGNTKFQPHEPNLLICTSLLCQTISWANWLPGPRARPCPSVPQPAPSLIKARLSTLDPVSLVEMLMFLLRLCHILGGWKTTSVLLCSALTGANPILPAGFKGAFQ